MRSDAHQSSVCFEFWNKNPCELEQHIILEWYRHSHANIATNISIRAELVTFRSRCTLRALYSYDTSWQKTWKNVIQFDGHSHGVHGRSDSLEGYLCLLHERTQHIPSNCTNVHLCIIRANNFTHPSASDTKRLKQHSHITLLKLQIANTHAETFRS